MAWHVPLLSWLAHAAVASLLVLTAGCLAVWWSRQPVRRLRLMELTLLGCLLAPWVSLWPALPHLSLGWLEAPPPSPVVDRPAEQPEPVRPAEITTLAPRSSPPGPEAASVPAKVFSPRLAAPSPAPAADPPAPPSLSLPPAPLLLAVAYGGIVALLLLRWLVGLAKLVQLRRTAYPVPEFVADLFASMTGPAGRRVRLVASDRVELPLAFGWRRPVIVLPGKLCTAGDLPLLRCCLAHEWSHVERRDVRTWHLATLAQLLFFYQPLLWWLRRQLRLCQDYLADARAAAQAASAEDYAGYLVTLASRRLGLPATAGLGIGDRHSNLYRRILMLVHSREPLERRCPWAWNLGVTLTALALVAAVACLRLEAGAKPEAPRGTPAKEKPATPTKGKTLTYTGKVTDKKTGKPIRGATVTVRRSVNPDPKTRGDRVLQETKHQTDAHGKYTFTIPPEQVAEPRLYIELDVEHPDYAPKTGFGYALGMILKNEKMGGRPFFEAIDLNPAKAVTGLVQTPDGKPAAGVEVLTYSVPDGEFMGSFGRSKTDARGRFRVMIATPGDGVFWLIPKDSAPSSHVVNDKRGDMGIFGLEKGIVLAGKVLDAKGKPAAGVYVEADRVRGQEGDDNFFARHAVADQIRRDARTNDKGEFVMAPLPPGKYKVQPIDYHYDSSTRSVEHHTLPGVFVAEQVTLKEGGMPDPVELVAVPTVTIEAQYLDSKGKPRGGHEIMIFGQRGKSNYWFGQGRPDANGHILTQAPLGLTNVQVQLMTNEHSSLRFRMRKGAPLSNLCQIKLPALKNDLKGMEIIRYEAPIVVVKVTAKDGAKLKHVQVTGNYADGKGPFVPRLGRVNGLPSDVSFEHQEDGRFRSEQLLPDEEVTVTAHADGYKARSLKLKLPEKAAKDVELGLERVSPGSTKTTRK